MRNIGGFIAQRKVTRALIGWLKLSKTPCFWLDGSSRGWSEVEEDDPDIETRLRGLSWAGEGKRRTLVYNVTVPIVGNNIDLVLMNSAHSDWKTTQTAPTSYIAFGELKGGIDPAGADEHWKTARTALSRIREAFGKKKLVPHTFFIGAAIEAKMAKEIWQLLRDNTLENAANLTNDDQISSLVQWLCQL